MDLDKLKGIKALSLLGVYEGRNPYLIKLKSELKQKGKLALSNTQEAYILNNHDREPVKVDRVVGLSSYIGEELKEKFSLSFTPERMYFGFILAETEKSYHVYGKLKKNQKENSTYWIPKTQVMEDPYFAPINVEVDFTKYTALDVMGRKPYGHQESGVKFLLSRDGAILADDMGLGKAEYVDNQVFTPNGRQKIGTLRVGDYVIGSDGKPTLVEGVFPQGTKDLYRVTFNDGYSILVCKEHLWSVTSNNGSVNNKNRPVRYTTLSVEQMLDENLELKQIGTGWNEKRPYNFKTYYKQPNGQNKWQIPIVKPIEFNGGEVLPIEPYLLGVVLGDGHILENKAQFALHMDDFDEMFDGCEINEKKSLGNIRRGTIKLGESIRKLGLSNTRSNTKFVPDIYKYSSVNNRIAILQGLMDTDGFCSKSDRGIFVSTEYCTVSKQLADDVAEIVHSLGGIVRMRTKIGSYKKPDGTKVLCKKAYRLNIKFSNHINPFRLKRKANEYNPPQKYKVGRYIKDIQLEMKGEAVCIQVAAKDHLYVSEHGIVTHNTYQTIVAALESGAEKIIIICPSSAKINWKREIEMFGETDIAIMNGYQWKSAKWMIINFDILKNFHTITPNLKADRDAIEHWVRDIYNENVPLLVIDEAHKVKDHKSQRGAIVGELTKNPLTKRVWLLTGTPVANRPKDFFNLLKLIKSPLADNYMFYTKRYCDGKNIYKKKAGGGTYKVMIANGESNLDELAIRSKNYLMRRLKTEVLDMPPKIVTPHHYELTPSQRTEYDYLWEEYMIERKAKKKKGNPDKDLVEVIMLRKFVAMTAIENTIEMAETAIEEGQKVVIFTTFKDEQEALAAHFGSICVQHNGSMNGTQKQNSVDKFQNNKGIKVFIGNIISAGVAITLTKGTVVIFNSFDWVPGNNEQAEDRTHRIGQEETVNVYYQLFDDTISTRMWYTIKKKRDIIDRIIGTNGENNISDVVDYILEED